MIVQELRRAAGYVIDDEVRHDFDVLIQHAHVIPRSKPRIDSRVVDRVETRIRAIDWKEKRKQMDTAECTIE